MMIYEGFNIHNKPMLYLSYLKTMVLLSSGHILIQIKETYREGRMEIA